eukprot:3098005-Rhodomonas_salina.2
MSADGPVSAYGISLRACYAVSGTDLAYAATSEPWRSSARDWCAVYCAKALVLPVWPYSMPYALPVPSFHAIPCPTTPFSLCVLSSYALVVGPYCSLGLSC